ncbi:MAG TPA: hypothetical protein VEH62_04900 [Gemmatimonadales bacterium]|nr:hypothetical protein [Gemmatimonadales bacterium]
MAGIRLRSGLIGVGIAAAALCSPGAARAQAPAADSGTLIDQAAVQARIVANRIDSVAAAQAHRGRAARPDPGLALYTGAVASLNKMQPDSALVPLQAAAAVGRDVARYHGDLAYALALLDRMDDAGAEYLTAIRLQGANPWYYVGLAMVRTAQQRWQEAAANFTLAYATDSTILKPDLIAAASVASEKSGDEPGLFDWSQRGTQKFPDFPGPWLRLASLLRARGDTARGLAAIRRFHTLKPNDRLGDAVLALYFNDIGQRDSSLELAIESGKDTAYRQYAGPILLRLGAEYLSNRQYDPAARALSEGLAISPPNLHERFVYYLSYANLQRLVPMYTEAVPKHDCQAAHVVDSLLTQVDHGFHETVQQDSAQVTHILNDILPNIHARVGEFVQQCGHN